ncbi:hypothetical protein ACT5C9_004280, partial [Vibrio vulnificus]|nr:hypothetical protein [Vibrio vulnificus]ELV8661970.1 hypothetical protein [Vibrio vulnificus]ELV8751175.1 hypothetical protein [Vibrio vulnificus]ELV8795555.1 hypothetical protein [Vibrio vulnificus]
IMLEFVRKVITSLRQPSRRFWEWKYHEVIAEQIKLSFLPFVLIATLSCYSAKYHGGKLPLVGSVAREFIQIDTAYLFFLSLLPLMSLFVLFYKWKAAKEFVARIISSICHWSFTITVAMTSVVAGLALPFALSLIKTEDLYLKLGNTLFLLFIPSLHYCIAKFVQPGVIERLKKQQ